MLSRVSSFSKIKVFSLLVLFLTFFTTPVKAEEHEDVKTEETEHHDAAEAKEGTEHKEGKKKFNAGEMIMEHIADNHEWHVVGHFAIPLPVILYSKENGLDMFMSSRFEPHHVEAGEERRYAGYIMVGKKITLESGEKLYDFSITKNVASLLISAALLLLVFLSIARSYKKREGKAPKGLQSLLEPIILFVRDDIARPTIGHRYKTFMPLLLTIFFFIFFGNLLGLIPFFPGGANLTGNIAITAFLALIILAVVSFIANKHYWVHIFAMPGVPKWVLIILTPIELLGFFLRPFVLMVRLFANITAGHIIALSFYSLIFIFGDGGKNLGAGFGVSVVSVLFTVFMFFMELLVAFLQAFVFTLLASIYFGSAIEEPAHH
jgi:F-type H+-transporting ATPase subunit a